MTCNQHVFFILWVFLPISILAQQNDSLDERFSMHAQTTVVNQSKTAFTVPYSGANSLISESENKTSITSTLFMGMRLWKGAGVFLNPEIAGGSGLSQALGLGDATNGETFRVGSPEPKIYLARLYVRQLFALGKSSSYQASDFNRLGGQTPDRYLAFTVGKIGVADFFDQNTYSHDPRAHFLCWSLMNNGAWDYAANVRGYTPSMVMEYVSPVYECRYSVSLVPYSANGNEMNWNLNKASSHNLELCRHHRVGDRRGVIRVMGFYTSANMGDYRQSIALKPNKPDITSTRQYGNNKYGFCLNIEQELNGVLGFFMRAGWNDGNHETWMFTEIDHTLSGGFSFHPKKRKHDELGLAYVISGLSAPHRDYLNAGGYGFMLGDGTLRYTQEQLGELYYAFEMRAEQIFLSPAYQFLLNPGFNADRRGPVHVFSIRLHARI
ncbi:MAG TPA: carbohydrate porin [Bacteroidia bacterium]|nr:carbohydrate porin [Bacteroidia bacterium]